MYAFDQLQRQQEKCRLCKVCTERKTHSIERFSYDLEKWFR